MKLSLSICAFIVGIIVSAIGIPNMNAQQMLSVTYSNSAAAIPTSYNLFALAQASSPQFSLGTAMGSPSDTASYTWVSGQSINVRLSGGTGNGASQGFFFSENNTNLVTIANYFNAFAIVIQSSTPSVTFTLSGIQASIAFGPSAQVNDLSVTGPSSGTATKIATITGYNGGDLSTISGTLTYTGPQASGFDMVIYGFNVPEPNTYIFIGVAMTVIAFLARRKRLMQNC